MRPNAQKNRKLIKQYPFIAEILKKRLRPYGDRNKNIIHTLKINFEKADGNLMFRRADNVGINDTSFIFLHKINQKHQVMKRGEYFFATDGNGKIVNYVKWPRNNEELRANGEVYGQSVLWTERITFASGRQGYAKPIWNKVKYLVWVTVETRHVDTRIGTKGRYGELKDRAIHITIYGEPDQGFEKLQKESSVYLNLSLDSQVMIHGACDNNYDIIIISGMLQELCNTFQEEVYFNGMRDRIKSEIISNPFDKFNTVEVFSNESCGVEQIRLADNNSYITFNLSSRAKQLYVAGQEGTLPQIRNLVRTVVRSWNNNPESRILHNNQTT